MEFRILGPLEAWEDDRALALGGTKQRAVLATLLINANRAISVDRLIDQVWGQEPPKTAATALQGYVSGLRRALEPARGRRGQAQRLLTRPPGYLLVVGPDELDLHRFERLAQQGRTALAAGDPAGGMAMLRKALGLFRGQPLAEFAFEAFAGPEIERIEEARLAAVEDRIEADLALGGHAGVVGELDALIAEHPLRERLRAQRMLALYRSGRQGEALAAYQDARDVLAEEMGIDPSPALQRLHRDVLAQDSALEWVPLASETPGPAAEERSLPETDVVPVPHAAREERKTITILSCDLGVLTLAPDAADPEDVQAALRPYQAAARAEIERFGGTVEGLSGDELTAVFGVPVTHEDDAERAVRCGLQIIEAVAELGHAQPENLAATRIGIATGSALVSVGDRRKRGEGIATGDVVATASSLQASAPPGGLLVTEATHGLTEDAITYELPEEVTTRHRARTLRTWQAVGARARPGTRHERPTVPLVGRRDELDLLRATWRRTLREQSAQLVTILGQPGIGKSRLVHELFEHLHTSPDLVAWREGRCLPYGEGITFWALGEVVKAEAGILESDHPEQAGERLRIAVEALVDADAERAWLQARLAPLVGLEAMPGADREEAFTAWRRFLEAIAARNPLVLVLEDLHWADQSLLAFIEQLIAWATGVPLLVVTTARPELRERRPTWGVGSRDATTISLSPLSDDETAGLIAGLLGPSVLPAPTQVELISRAEGNPLYAEEFVRMLRDRGAIDNQETVTQSPGATFPPTIEVLIAARLDTLAPERKELLHHASVVGRVFWSGAVAAMSGMEDADVRGELHELARTELIRSVRDSSVAGQSEYSFSHALIKDVAYAQIPRARRSERHVAAAAWIESLAGERVADHAEMLAYHYATAIELGKAAETSTDELQEPARRFLVLAGRRALDFDVEKAIECNRAALALTPTEHPDRTAILIDLAEALYRAGELEEAEERYDEAVAAFRGAGDSIRAGAAMTKISVVLWERGEGARSHDVLSRAIEVLEAQAPGEELASAYAEKTAELMTSGLYGECLTMADRALALTIELGIDEDTARVLGYRGYARSVGGDPRGLDDCREAVRMALELGLTRRACVLYNNLCATLDLLDGPVAALEAASAGLELAMSRGLRQQATFCKANKVAELFALGRWAEAISSSEEILAEEEGRSPSYPGALAGISLAQMLALSGRAAEATVLADRVLPLARRTGDAQMLGSALGITALATLADGDRASAALLAREAVEVSLQDPSRREGLSGALRTLAAAGALDGSVGLPEEEEGTTPVNRLHVKACGAAVTEAAGDPSSAVELYTAVAEEFGRRGFVVECAHAEFGAGRCLFALGRTDDAARLLGRAHESFSGMGADFLAREIALWLSKVGAA